MQINYIKNKLSINDVLSLLEELEADYNYISSSEIHFKSICHNSNSYKLYYYIDSKTFYCHRDGKSWDIFSLIAQIKGINYSNAVKYVVNKLNMSFNNVNVDDWQQLKSYLPEYKDAEVMQVYNKNILNEFEDRYCSKWLNDGISVKTMKKYDIKWCNRNASIIIPCFDAGYNLIGIRQRYLRSYDVSNGKYKPYTDLFKNSYKFSTSLNLYGININKAKIKENKKCILLESEKSVLQMDTMFDKNNIGLALYGTNVSKWQKETILKMGVEEVIIGLDFDYINTKDNLFGIYKDRVLKIKKMFSSYCKVSVLFDNNNHKCKDSPTDNGKEYFLNLYNNRIDLT